MFHDLRCASFGILPQDIRQVNKCKGKDAGLVFDGGLLHHGYLRYSVGLLAPGYIGRYLAQGVLGCDGRLGC